MLNEYSSMQQQPKPNNPMFNQRLNELMTQIKAVREQIAMMDKLVGTPAQAGGAQSALGALPSGPMGGPGALGTLQMGMGPAGGPSRIPLGISGPGPSQLGGPQAVGMQASKFQQWAAPGMQGPGDMGGLDPASELSGAASGGLASIDVGVPEFIPGQPWAGAQSLKQDPTQDPFMTPAQYARMQGGRIPQLGLGSVTTAGLGGNPGPGTSSTS